MVPNQKGVSKVDLLELKDEINKEQLQARHQQNNNIQKAYDGIDDLKTKQALTDNNINHMTTEIEKIAKKINEFIETADKKYATKQEISGLMKIVGVIGTGVIGALITAILKTIGWI